MLILPKRHLIIYVYMNFTVNHFYLKVSKFSTSFILKMLSKQRISLSQIISTWLAIQQRFNVLRCVHRQWLLKVWLLYIQTIKTFLRPIDLAKMLPGIYISLVVWRNNGLYNLSVISLFFCRSLSFAKNHRIIQWMLYQKYSYFHFY